MSILLDIREKLMDKKKQNWQRQKQILIAQEQIKKEKRQIKSESKKITTSKFLTFFLFASCTIIQAFTMFLLVKGLELGLEISTGPLEMLITSVAAEVVGFAIYSLKAAKQNTKGGIVYQTAMSQWENISDETLEQEEPEG